MFCCAGTNRYSANFALSREGSNPPNSAYHMNLQQARFTLSPTFNQELKRRYEHADRDAAASL